MSLLVPPRPGVQEQWTFGRGKHAGETLDEVAENDPGYLRWVWSEPIPDEAVRAIEECAEEHDVDLDRPKRK